MQQASRDIDRIAPTQRPDGKPIGQHTWSNLLFVHWKVPRLEVERFLPDELSVDTFEGSAWIGLVPFQLSGVRPWWFPPVPGISSFYETNVRTYVHLDGKDPGVWFFSLDAASSLAVRIARSRWHLPYHRAHMTLERSGGAISYTSSRLWPGRFGVGGRIEAEVGDSIGALDKSVPSGQAVPGTIEHFLAERYFFYAQSAKNTLIRGRVHHSAYPLCEARMRDLDQTLVSDAGFDVSNRPDHVLFSKGVNVDVFGLEPAT